MKFVLFTMSAVALLAQTQQKQQRAPMTFFITSTGMGNGANLGGLAGADAHCQKLAEAAGSTGKIWRAYLSTQAEGGKPAVNARDRTPPPALTSQTTSPNSTPSPWSVRRRAISSPRTMRATKKANSSTASATSPTCTTS